MTESNDFSNFSRQINMYLDNELGHEDRRAFIQSVRGNSQLDNMLDNERSFRHFVKNNVHRSHVAPTLIQSIKEKIKIS